MWRILLSPQNGNKSKKTINEGQTLLTVFKEGYAPDGVWLGGTKYQFINIERDLEFEGYTFDVATCAKLKGGLHLIKVPGGNILVVLYDEEKEHDRGRMGKLLHLVVYFTSFCTSPVQWYSLPM